VQNQLKVFSGSSNRALAQEICDELGIELGRCKIIRFANDNTFVQIQENARECDVYVVQSSSPPVNEMIMELLIMVDALRSASAKRITAVLPYYPYARSDKKDMPRISIIARLVADLIKTAGSDRVLTLTLHAPQIHGFFTMPSDHLTATPVLCEYFKEKDLAEFVAVGADAGSAKRAGTYASALDIPLAFVDKRRIADHQVEVRGVIGEVKGKHAIIFDDEIATGTSVLESVTALEGAGVRDIYCGATHGVLCGGAAERLQDSPIKEVVVTNAVPIPPERRFPKLRILSVAPLFAEAIRRIHTGDSVSQLFADPERALIP
jgi:ribose-phosphate pyrophosphokinase